MFVNNFFLLLRIIIRKYTVNYITLIKYFDY